MNCRKTQRGFTLIELMVVVVILGILVAYVTPKIMDRPDEAKVVKVKQDIRALENAIYLYKLDNHKYPSTDDGLEALVKDPGNAPNWKKGGYLNRMPKDPWNKPYYYLQPGAHGDFDIYSHGADDREGGEGVNADIGNWNLE